MPTCSQCQNVAMWNVEGHALCLHCYEKLMKIQHQQIAEHNRMINFLKDEMDEIVGIPTSSRIQMPQPVVHKGNVTHNFINIDRSVVGSVNTGKINNLNQSMNNINNQVNPEIAKLLSLFTESMLKSQEINKDIKDELLEEVSFLSEQLLAEKSLQKKGMLKRTIESIESKVSTAGTLLTIWQAINPILKTLFGF